MAAHADDVITLASASDAEDVVVVSLDFVSFHTYNLPQLRQNTRDFLRLCELFLLTGTPHFLKKIERAFEILRGEGTIFNLLNIYFNTFNLTYYSYKSIFYIFYINITMFMYKYPYSSIYVHPPTLF